MKKSVLLALAAVVVLIGAGVFVVLPSLDDDGADDGDLNALTQDRTFTANTTYLSVTGAAPMPLKGGGGEAFADVVEADLGGPFLEKHLGGRQIAPIVVTSSGVFPSKMASWASELWAGNGGLRSGAYHETDFNQVETLRRDYRDAVLSEVGLPGCDSASSATPTFAFTVQPAQVQEMKGSGQALRLDTTKQRPAAMACRIALEGLDLTRVTKVDPFAITTAVKDENVGEFREPAMSPRRTSFPPLVLTVSDSGAQTLKDWHRQTVIDGNDSERSGTMSYMDSALAQAVVTLSLTNCGIFRLNRILPSGDGPVVVKAHIYCEQMSLSTAP